MLWMLWAFKPDPRDNGPSGPEPAAAGPARSRPCSPGWPWWSPRISPVVAGAFAGLALSGFFSIWLIAAANTLVQLRAGPALRGRVIGIWTMALPGSYPVSGLLVALVSGVSPRAGFSLSGVAMVAVALVTWTALAIRTSVIPAPFGPSLIVAPRTLDETRSGHGT